MRNLSTPSPVRTGATSRDYDRLVSVTLASYWRAHGPREAERRLRSHIPHWPKPALAALVRIAKKGAALS
jgi:hypothetical protein